MCISGVELAVCLAKLPRRDLGWKLKMANEVIAVSGLVYRSSKFRDFYTMETRDQELFCVGDGLQATSAAT